MKESLILPPSHISPRVWLLFPVYKIYQHPALGIRGLADSMFRVSSDFSICLPLYLGFLIVGLRGFPLLTHYFNLHFKTSFKKILYLAFLNIYICRVSLASLLGIITSGWLLTDKFSSKLTRAYLNLSGDLSQAARPNAWQIYFFIRQLWLTIEFIPTEVSTVTRCSQLGAILHLPSPPKGIWQYLKTFFVVTIERGYYWYLVGRKQRCC